MSIVLTNDRALCTTCNKEDKIDESTQGDLYCKRCARIDYHEQMRALKPAYLDRPEHEKCDHGVPFDAEGEDACPTCNWPF